MRALDDADLNRAFGKIDLHSGAESGIFTISHPIEHRPHDGRGEAWAVSRHDHPLTNRQQALLDRLPEFDSRTTVGKSDVSMADLSALTAKTDNEFAMFTKGSERLVIRGDREHVNINPSQAAELNAQGYRWSGHTHVGDTQRHLLQSPGDEAVLNEFNQSMGVIYNAVGEHRTFGKR
jgi:hypothetical protein